MSDQPDAGNPLAPRAADGTFQKGVSGNPAGRPKGRKSEITELKQDLEIAVRKYLTVDKVARIVDKMVQLAEGGSVGAAKLLLDKVVSNAREAEDEKNAGADGIKIIIQNATFAANRDKVSVQPQAVEAEFIEVKQ